MGVSRLEAHDLWSFVELRALASPSRPLAFDEHDRQITFGELRDRGARVAAGLLERGIAKGDRVVWTLPTRIEALVLMAALARLRCVQIPLIPASSAREIGFVLRQAKPAWAIVPGRSNGVDFEALFVGAARGDSAERAEATMADPPAGSIGALAHDGHRSAIPAPGILCAAPDLPEADPTGLDTIGDGSPPARRELAAWIFYTSGTTSDPKGVLHADATLLASAIGLDAPHAFTPEDRVSLVFPIAHIGGPILLFSALRVGHALILSETFAADVVTPALSRHGVTLAGPGPAFWQAFLEAQRRAGRRRLFPALRALIGGGAAKPARLHAEAREVLGVPIVSGYGLTECPSLAYNHVGDPDEVLASDGRAVEGALIRITDRDGVRLAAGQEGEIRVRGSMLFLGYLDGAVGGEALDRDGFLATGDLGTLDARGSLRVTGRIKDVIIRKGENLSAKQIEDVLATHAGVADVAVVGLPDPERGERCCAVIVPRDSGRSPSLADLVEHCARAGLMRQKHPEQIEIVTTLPRNSTGKVLKAELRKRLGAAR
jgi:acyl-CoA synthetase (AMP-forming)/AMP-acid ligase II